MMILWMNKFFYQILCISINVFCRAFLCINTLCIQYFSSFKYRIARFTLLYHVQLLLLVHIFIIVPYKINSNGYRKVFHNLGILKVSKYHILKIKFLIQYQYCSSKAIDWKAKYCLRNIAEYFLAALIDLSHSHTLQVVLN